MKGSEREWERAWPMVDLPLIVSFLLRSRDVIGKMELGQRHGIA